MPGYDKNKQYCLLQTFYPPSLVLSKGTCLTVEPSYLMSWVPERNFFPFANIKEVAVKIGIHLFGFTTPNKILDIQFELLMNI